MKRTKTWKKRILDRITLGDGLARDMLSEFYCTFIVSVFVHAAVAQDTLSRTMSSFNVSIAVSLGVVFAVYSGFGVSGGHINLALSVGIASIGVFPWKKVPFYFAAQVAGGFVGAAVVYLVYQEALDDFDGGVRQVFGENGTAGIFATFPQPFLSVTTGFFEQVLNTALLLAAIGAVMDRRNNPPPLSLAPFFFGLIVFTILMSYGYNAGAPLNPSVDLSGRLLLAAVGYGSDVWTPGGVHWWWVPIVGPTLGSAIGSLAYYFAIAIHHPPIEGGDEKSEDHDDSADFSSNPDGTKQPMKKKQSIIYQNHSSKTTPTDVSQEIDSSEEVSGPLCVDVIYSAPDHGMNGTTKAIYL